MSHSRGAAAAEPHVLANGEITVRLEQGTGRFTVCGTRTPAWQARSVALCPEISARVNEVASVDHRDALGSAKAVEFRSDHGTQRVWVYDDDVPLVFTAVRLRNATGAAREIRDLTPLTVALEAPVTVEALRRFGADGLDAATTGKASYMFVSVVEPNTRAGLVAGWVTHERASGVAEARYENGRLLVSGRSEYGRLPIAQGADAQGETFALGFFDDARDGLEAFADVTAKANGVKLLPILNGYSTWYHARALDQERMATLAKFAKDNRLDDYGLDFLQIDDQWQVHRRDFVTHNPTGPYPDGMKTSADAIQAHGFAAGLWITPFGWQGQDVQDGKPVPNKTSLKDKPEYFVKKPDGSIYQVRWAGDCLDMSHPGARDFLRGVIARMTHDWGYKLLKIDGLWAGMACRILYPSPAYRDDDLGDAVFHDPSKTNVEVYRDGLKLVREAAGDDTFLLGCNVAQNMRTMGASIGLVDAMRVGPDIGASWDKIVRCVKPAGWLYFLNGRVWHNDPDCLMLRDSLTLENGRAWASWVALSGQMNLVSEWLPDLPPEKLDVYKRTIPNHLSLKARPVDLFDRDVPRVWHLAWGEGDDRHDVVGLFNWNFPREDDSAEGISMEEPTSAAPRALTTTTTKPSELGPATIQLDLERLGLPADATYAAFDFWQNQFLPDLTRARSFTLEPGSCKVIALTRRTDRPQLLSTSRHVSQGLVDVKEVRWDPASCALSGVSRVVGGDRYKLRIACPHLMKADRVTGPDGVTAAMAADAGHVRVSLTSAETRDVAWRINFTAAYDAE